jgi:hypothetical protein
LNSMTGNDRDNRWLRVEYSMAIDAMVQPEQ